MLTLHIVKKAHLHLNCYTVMVLQYNYKVNLDKSRQMSHCTKKGVLRLVANDRCVAPARCDVYFILLLTCLVLLTYVVVVVVVYPVPWPCCVRVCVGLCVVLLLGSLACELLKLRTYDLAG